MKALLVLSLILNIVLGYLLMTKKPEKEIIERVIIETHEKKSSEVPVPVDTRNVVQPPVPAKKEKKEKKDSFGFIPLENVDIQDAAEKMESERTDFMTAELGMTEDKIKEHNRLRDDFFKQSASFFQKDAMAELTFKQRRQMIDMEEKLHKNLEKLHGKKNWERYQKFRDSYNQKAHKRQLEEQRPFVFMGL
jgi:hypothetical protein